MKKHLIYFLLIGGLQLSACAQQKDDDAIKRVVQQEAISYDASNYEDWTKYWAHEPDIVWVMNLVDGGYKKVTGWDELNKMAKIILSDPPKPGTVLKIDFTEYIVRQTGLLACISFKQVQTDADRVIEIQQSRVLEKKDGEWKIISSSSFIPWNDPSPVAIKIDSKNLPKFQPGTYTLTTSPFKTAITFSNDGTYSTKRAGEVVTEGTYKVDNNLIEVTDIKGSRACKGTTGKYKWSLNGKAMNFIRIDDLCGGRLSSYTKEGWMLE